MKTLRLACAAACLTVTFVATPASAGVYGDELAKCLVKTTSAEDRTVLVKWIFAALGLHPTVKAMFTAPQAERDKIDQQLGQLFERLITVSCKQQTQDAVRYEGPQVFESSFQVLGQVAARELFADPSVSASMANFMKYIDKDKLKSVVAVPPAPKEPQK
jgi:hypothetical protein